MTSFSVESPMDEKGVIVEIFDNRNLKYEFLEPSTESVTTYYHTAAETAAEDVDKPNCSADELALASASNAYETILGYAVIPIVAPPSNQVGDAKLIAPALNCYPLRRTEFLPVGSRNEFTVTSVEEGEPPAALFEAPPDYVERSPSELNSAYYARYHVHLYNPAEALELDRRYYNHQTR